MANLNEPSQNEPDQQFIDVLRAITGVHNITADELTKPILRPTIQNTYILYIIQYALLSVIGAVSNCWCIYYISKHKLYRDTTHAFFMNLSICHFVQSAFVVPVTLVTTIVHNWVLGTFMCYFVPMLQVRNLSNITNVCIKSKIEYNVIQRFNLLISFAINVFSPFFSSEILEKGFKCVCRNVSIGCFVQQKKNVMNEKFVWNEYHSKLPTATMSIYGISILLCRFCPTYFDAVRKWKGETSFWCSATLVDITSSKIMTENRIM